MITLNQLIKKLHKDDRESNFVNALFTAIYNKMAEVNNYVAGLKNEFFFDTLTLFSITAYEKLMNITPFTGATIEDRRAGIWARWRANGKNTIQLIQDICNSWQNGKIWVRFIGGKIKLQLTGSYEILSTAGLNKLINEIDEIKPAHLPYLFLYLLTVDKNLYANVGAIESFYTEFDCRNSL